MSDHTPKAPVHTASAEDLAQGRAKNVKTENARLRAVYTYEAKMADELTLQVNCEYIGIRLLEPEKNWWYGTTLNGDRAGIFPANYVERVVRTAQEKPSNTELCPVAVASPRTDENGSTDDGAISSSASSSGSGAMDGCCVLL